MGVVGERMRASAPAHRGGGGPRGAPGATRTTGAKPGPLTVPRRLCVDTSVLLVAGTPWPALHPRTGLLTNAKKVTVSVLYWYKSFLVHTRIFEQELSRRQLREKLFFFMPFFSG